MKLNHFGRKGRARKEAQNGTSHPITHYHYNAFKQKCVRYFTVTSIKEDSELVLRYITL